MPEHSSKFMGRRTPTWILERQLDNAKKREAYYKDKHKSDATFKNVVDKRPRMRVGYRCLYKTIKTGTGTDTSAANAVLSILASEAACRWFEGVAAGATLGTGNTALGLDYTNVDRYVEYDGGGGFQPSKIHASIGGTTTPHRTAWGTRTIRYTRSAQGEAQASYTAPISILSGAIAPALLIGRAETIAKNRKGSLGGENGKMWYELESSSTTLDTD